MEQALFDELPAQAVPERPDCGVARLRVPERRQVASRAVSLDELVAGDHRVRLVWRFVEGLDLSPLYAGIEAVAGRPGHPPAEPRLLVALWLHATLEGVGSARALARPCAEHLAFQWLCGGVGMNHKTLSDFRVAHGGLLERLLIDSFAALLQTGVARLDRVAQDGVRVRAAAGAASFRRHASLQACHRRARGGRCSGCAASSMPIPARPAGARPRRAGPRPRIASAGSQTPWPSPRRCTPRSRPAPSAPPGGATTTAGAPGRRLRPRRRHGPRPPIRKPG